MRTQTEKIYLQLKKELSQGGVDVLLPTERELSERYSVGRSTIRTALRQLELDGFIHSRGFHGARQVAIPNKAMGKVVVVNPCRGIFRNSAECLGIFSGICNSIHEKQGEILPFFQDHDSVLETLCQNYKPDEYNGVIFIESCNEWYEKLKRRHIPVVVANYESSMDIISTRVDFRMMGRMVGLELLRKGYQRIGIIGQHPGYINDEMAAGLRGALAEERIWLEDDYLVPYDYYDGDEKSKAITESQIVRLLTSEQRPQAFFVFRYLRTTLLFDIAKRLHLRIPEDLGIVVYDTPQEIKELNHTLSIMEEPSEALGRNAVDLLLDYNAATEPAGKKLLPTFVDNGSLPPLT